MKTIRLKSICLQNFKGTRYLLLNFANKNAEISGENGSGKSTVYKAYYWCLTGKTLEPNEVVQTLNVYNEVIHKVETHVTVTLTIDDSYDVVLERKLVEKWRALGRPDEELKGTEQQRFWNDVPLTQKEFDAKLAGICDIEKWLLLSDINKFMSIKVDERRKLLLSIAGDVDESTLLKPYPELLEAVASKKTLTELKIQTLSTKKRANEELKTIPAQITAQDILKVDENFSLLRSELKTLDTEISDIDKLMQGSTETLTSARAYRKKLDKAHYDLITFTEKWREQHVKDCSKAFGFVESAIKTLQEATDYANKCEAENNERVKAKVKLQEEFADLRDKWNEANNSEFDFNSADCCPYCGHRFTDEEKAAKKDTAIAEYNKHKAEQLKALQVKAEQVNAQILAITGVINEYSTIIKPKAQNAVIGLKNALKQAQTDYDAITSKNYEDEKQYIALKNALEKLREEKPENGNQQQEDNAARKNKLVARRDTVIRLLAGEQTNKRIEEEKERLQARSKELVQIVADCDKVLWEIQEYRKAMVDAVEGKVNSFFSIARWKFYEKNISNDDLQEVCICHHKGIDYNSTNGADRINLGIDIIAGLSKAYELQVPLFIDNAEAVNTILPTESQQITLRVTKDEFKMDLIS